MNDELADYLIHQLGLPQKSQQRPGLERAINAFLGAFLGQRTPIQEQAIEVIYDGSDSLLVASTASGKTEAAIIPIAARLLTDQEPSLALYVAPTRALLNDLHERLNAPLHQLGLESNVRHGDHALPTRTEAIRVLFTTPESLDVLLSKNAPILKRTKYVIVDEIHQIFGNPRGDQLAFGLQRLRRTVSRPLQMVALSATVGDPDAIAVWLCPQAQPARVISDGGQRQIIAEFQWQSDISLFRRILRDSGQDKALIFVNSRRRCDDVYLALRNCEPHEVYVHYSSLSKQDREHVEKGFKSAQFAACVATSTLELGIDIGSVQHVVLADSPTSVSSFLQRIGRGGRRGNTNHVRITPRTLLELLQSIALLQSAEAGQVEAGWAGHPYSIVIQQVFSILAGKRRLQVHPAELAETFGVWPWLSRSTIELILDRLVAKDFLRRSPAHQTYEIGPLLEDLLDERAIHSNIAEESTGVAMYHGETLVAHLPLRRDQIRHGNVILFAGRYWQITSITEQGMSVDLSYSVPNPIRPTWGSKGAFALSATLARGMRDVILQRPVLDSHGLDEECRRQLLALYRRSPGLAASDDLVWHEREGVNHIYYTFAGALENRVLQLLFEKHGMECRPVTRAEGVALTSRELLDFGCLTEGEEGVTSVAAGNWREFTNWVSRGPFFEYLPSELKRDETLSQITSAQVLRNVLKFSHARVVEVSLKLIGDGS